MIIRVLRASLARVDRPVFVAFLRGRVLPGTRSVPGLVSFYSGLRDDGDVTRVALVGVWEELGELASAVGDFERPRWLDDVGVPIEIEAADLYELAGRSFPGVGQIRGEILQILSARIGSNAEAAFHERLRKRQDALASEDALHALHVGRRVTRSGTEIIAVAVWRDRESLLRLGRADFEAMPDDETAEWIHEARLHTYEAVDDEAAETAATLPGGPRSTGPI